MNPTNITAKTNLIYDLSFLVFFLRFCFFFVVVTFAQMRTCSTLVNLFINIKANLVICVQYNRIVYVHVFSWTHPGQMHLARDASRWMHPVETHLARYIYKDAFMDRSFDSFMFVYFLISVNCKKHHRMLTFPQCMFQNGRIYQNCN